MKTLLTTIDRAAEHMEGEGHGALAAVLDSVSEEMAKREGDDEFACANGTCADGTCADEDGMCPDGSVATAAFLFRDKPDDKPVEPKGASAVLTESAPQLFQAVKPYGAKAYSVDNDTVEVALDRGAVETVASFQFCSQDNAGKPQLRITFESGGERMVRWASLETVTGAAIEKAAEHVFGTGRNYGDNVVVAQTAKPTYRLVDSIEQAVADNAASREDVGAALAAFGTETLRSALPHVDDWTRRYVTRHLTASAPGWGWGKVNEIAKKLGGKAVRPEPSSDPYQAYQQVWVFKSEKSLSPFIDAIKNKTNQQQADRKNLQVRVWF